jgi:hypothetical protein
VYFVSGTAQVERKIDECKPLLLGRLARLRRHMERARGAACRTLEPRLIVYPPVGPRVIE